MLVISVYFVLYIIAQIIIGFIGCVVLIATSLLVCLLCGIHFICTGIHMIRDAFDSFLQCQPCKRRSGVTHRTQKSEIVEMIAHDLTDVISSLPTENTMTSDVPDVETKDTSTQSCDDITIQNLSPPIYYIPPPLITAATKETIETTTTSTLENPDVVEEYTSNIYDIHQMNNIVIIKNYIDKYDNQK